MAEESNVKIEFDNNGNRIGKVIARNVSDSVGQRMAEPFGFHADGINFRCLCVPSGAPLHSGRYPWKDDDNEIREVFNMDSNRFNRFVSMINAAGGHFQVDNTGVGDESMATIQIPASMLYHLHIDGDGSIGLLKKIITPKIPAISQIQIFNDRAIQITFADGSQTKCVCGKDEFFDLYEGIAFCLFKRFLGKDTGHKQFNNLMRYAMKTLNEQEKAKEREAEIEAEKKRHEEKKKLQAERRKAKKREEKIGIFVEALRKNREIMMEEGWCPMVKPDENPEKEG